MNAGVPAASPPHGFGDDEATRRLLRSRPPPAALRWAGAAAGGTVTAARALRGGMSSAIHALTVALPGGGSREVVLRRYVRPPLDAEEIDVAAREGRVLQFADAIGVPTPRLVAVDPDGGQAGVHAVLMSRLPGRLQWSPADLAAWLRSLAALLPPIHGTQLPPPGVIRPFAHTGRSPTSHRSGPPGRSCAAGGRDLPRLPADRSA